MVIHISFQADMSKALRHLDVMQKQVKFATAKALTKTAQDVQAGLKKEMKRVFDRPTPYTLNSLRVKPATKERLQASVFLKDDTFKGTPAAKYLGPQIAGGSRALKRFEASLLRVGLLPPGHVAVPGGAARLDRYGNMRPGQITQILSGVRASNDPTQNRRRGKAGQYFIGRPGHAPLGVWQRVGRGVQPVLIYVKAPNYQPRLAFRKVGERIARENFSKHFEAALRQAMTTAR